MKKTLTNLFIFFIAISITQAQNVITGNVKADGDILGMTGVTVKVKDFDVSTITDLQGDFSIILPPQATTLVFIFDGFETKEVIVGNRSVIDVKMTSSVSSNNNIGTNTGYGSLDKNSSTSSNASIDASQLGQQPVVTLEQANQGRASGVLVQNSGGQLGAPASVLIRGGSSLTASNQPLYVVDGIPLTSGNQSDINPNNVASIDVLKDASAIAIYGSRAANGVIVITTKNGVQGGVKFDADYQFGVSTAPRRLDVISATEYRIQAIESFLRVFTTGFGANITRTELENIESAGIRDVTLTNGSGRTLNVPIPSNIIDGFQGDTDWQDEVFRTAIANKANFSLSGGSKDFQYFGGISYQNQEGIVVGNDFERFNAQMNLSANITSKLKASLNVSFARNTSNRVNEDADLGNPLQALVLPSADSFDPNNNFRLVTSSESYNPLTEINFSDFIETGNVGIANLGLDYAINNELTLSVDAGLDLLDERIERRQGPETLEGAPNGFSRLTELDVFNYLLNTSLNYEKRINNNKLSAVVGASLQNSTTDITFRSALVNSISQLEGLNSDSDQLLNNPVPGSASRIASLYGRFNYSINDKYVFQVSGRYDGSSRFGPNNQYGFFPAVSGAWNISNEDFFGDSGAFSYLKFKASFGLIGNTPSDDFLARTNYFLVNNLNRAGIRAENIANPDIKWEVTEQLDIGFDFGLLEDRISGSVNYYNKNTSDLLFPRPITLTSGFSSVIDNIASLSNTGFEFNISSTNISNANFSWVTDFNISTNNNEIKDLQGDRLVTAPSAFIEGESAGVFFLPRYVGVDPANGDALYDNGNGGTTADYDFALENARQVIGDPNPDFFGGLSNTLRYKSIELSFLFQFVGGVEIYNQTGEFFANSGFQRLGQRADQVDRWYSPGDIAQFPVLNPNQENTNPSSRFIEDGSFIRLNNLSLTYNVPASTVSKWGLRNLSFYIGGQNLFTITDYSGYDPDVNSIDSQTGAIGVNLLRNIDNFTAPQARTFITGIKIGF